MIIATPLAISAHGWLRLRAFEEKIRQRAYQLWEQNGKTGSEMDFWLQAEKEIAKRDIAAPPQDRLE